MITHPVSYGTAPQDLRQDKGLKTPVFFGLFLLYQVLLTFQGLDLLDEGFHVSFYQQIFRAPESVQYCFLYWFTGIAGGTWLKLFPSLGLWGLRLSGALTITATAWTAYALLRPFVRRPVLQISLALVVIFMNTEPRDLNYNSFSALLYFGSAALLFHGATKKRPILLVGAGALVALNMLARLPNLLGLGMAIFLFWYAHETEGSWTRAWKQVTLFFGGFIAALALSFVFMKAIGHLDLYLNALRSLFVMSADAKKGDGVDQAYSLKNLAYNLIKQNGIGMVGSVFYLGLVFFAALLRDKDQGSRWGRPMAVAFTLALLGGLAALSIFGKVKFISLLYFYTGISIVGGLLILSSSRNRDRKLAVLLGGFILLVHPFGSAPGIESVGLYSLWLCFPLAVQYLVGIRMVDSTIKVAGNGTVQEHQIIADSGFLRTAWWSTVAFIVFFCALQLLRKPYFYDEHPRWTMTAPVENPNMRFILTSPGRAASVNELLAESARYIRPGDQVLAYDCMPMYHFMTETRPWLNNPAPLFYATGIFRAEVAKAEASKALPVVVMQKIRTVHEASKWPETVLPEDYSLDEKNLGRNLEMKDFLARHGYQEVWSNSAFRILLPGASASTVK